MKKEKFIIENIHDIIIWIDVNIDLGINSNDVVKFSGYSRSYFLSEFYKLKNISLSCYIKNARFKLASEMLISTTLNINDISKKLGYSSQSSFCQIFKKYYAMSPTDYRYKMLLSRQF